MFLFDKNGRPKTITAKDLEPKIEDFFPELREVMEMNKRNFMSPHERMLYDHKKIDDEYKEGMNTRNDGFTVLGEKDKVEKKPYKQSCPPMSEEEEKKSIMKAKEDLDKKLQEKIEDLERWDNKAKNDVEKWFGSSDEISRQMLLSRTKKMKKLLSTYTVDNFKPASMEDIKKDPTLYAQVDAEDDSIIELGPSFCTAPAIGRDSKMGILAHEMSHFDSISSTDDFAYGDDAIDLIIHPKDKKPTIYNADNYEYYIEN